MDWFLYDNGLRHERAKNLVHSFFNLYFYFYVYFGTYCIYFFGFFLNLNIFVAKIQYSFQKYQKFFYCFFQVFL